MVKEARFIGEIGINHNGSVDLALELMRMAKECGCSAVKFQKRDPDICVPDDRKDTMRETQWGYIKYIEYKKKLEFSKEEYDIINDYSIKLGIDWFASAWDVGSLEFLKQYDLKYNKIASAMITHLELVEEVAKEGKLTFISTGMSNWEQIDKAIDLFKKYECPFVPMHCVGLYPCPDDKLNLNMINTIRDRYNCDVGYSGHSPGAMDAILAMSMGARYIEKHITLDRTMMGSDHAASLERPGLMYINKYRILLPKMLGNGRKYVYKDELKKAQGLRYI